MEDWRSLEETLAAACDEPDEETGEDEHALAADVHEPERRRFRRR